jgi:hypothetical protein
MRTASELFACAAELERRAKHATEASPTVSVLQAAKNLRRVAARLRRED